MHYSLKQNDVSNDNAIYTGNYKGLFNVIQLVSPIANAS
jgi:hypothetical protein